MNVDYQLFVKCNLDYKCLILNILCVYMVIDDVYNKVNCTKHFSCDCMYIDIYNLTHM